MFYLERVQKVGFDCALGVGSGVSDDDLTEFAYGDDGEKGIARSDRGSTANRVDIILEMVNALFEAGDGRAGMTDEGQAFFHQRAAFVGLSGYCILQGFLARLRGAQVGGIGKALSAVGE